MPEKGQHVIIKDAASNREIYITYGDAYTAARGKLCGYYYLEFLKSLSEADGNTCRGQSQYGEW